MTRWNRSVQVSVICWLALVGPAFGFDPPPAAPSPSMMTKVFDVTDLVCAPADFKLDAHRGSMTSAPSETVCADRLMSNITAMIAPGTWMCDGGAGRIEYFEKGRSLVVCHEKATVEQVAVALEKLTKRQDLTVAISAQVIHVPVGICDVCLDQIDPARHAKPGHVRANALTPEQLRSLLAECLGSNAARTRQLPKLTCYSGQTAVVAVGEMKPVEHTRIYALTGGTAYAIPVTGETYHEGLTLQVCPVISPDRKTVSVRLNCESASALPGTITLAEGQKVTLESFVNGKPAGPVEVAMTETARSRAIRSHRTAVTMRDGGTCLMDLGVCRTDGRKEQCLLLMTARVLPDATTRSQVLAMNCMSGQPCAPAMAPVVAASRDNEVVLRANLWAKNYHLSAVPPMPVAALPVSAPSAVPPPSVPGHLSHHSVALPPAEPDDGPQVYTRMLLFKTTAEGARKHGLTATQTLLNQAQFEQLRTEFTKKTRFEILSAPQLLLTDNQVGYYEDGCGQADCQKIRMTPTFSADRKFVRLRLEAECAGPGTPYCNVETTLSDDGAACYALTPKNGDPSADERMFLVVTPRFICSPDDRARVAAECSQNMTFTKQPAVVSTPVAPAQGIALAAVGYCQVDTTPTDRKAKAAEWVGAYEKACAGASGPSPAECALRALAEDPHCFARPAAK
jgi:hypothetical protein